MGRVRGLQNRAGGSSLSPRRQADAEVVISGAIGSGVPVVVRTTRHYHFARPLCTTLMHDSPGGSASACPGTSQAEAECLLSGRATRLLMMCSAGEAYGFLFILLEFAQMRQSL